MVAPMPHPMRAVNPRNRIVAPANTSLNCTITPNRMSMPGAHELDDREEHRRCLASLRSHHDSLHWPVSASRIS